jgi:hypothetical protein
VENARGRQVPGPLRDVRGGLRTGNFEPTERVARQAAGAVTPPRGSFAQRARAAPANAVLRVYPHYAPIVRWIDPAQRKRKVASPVGAYLTNDHSQFQGGSGRFFWVRPKRLLPTGFIVPCQPTLASTVPPATAGFRAEARRLSHPRFSNIATRFASVISQRPGLVGRVCGHHRRHACAAVQTRHARRRGRAHCLEGLPRSRLGL